MEDKKNYIIITSIFAPTKAVLEFAEYRDWQVLVVGDKKTPTNWECESVHFLSVFDQETCGYKVAELLPWNHYCRKIVGYIHAIKSGSQIIVDTDDDNIPKQNWKIPDFTNDYLTTRNDLGFINIYKSFTDMHIWPRGFPLNLITDQKTVLQDDDLVRKQIKVGIWQGLADGDPDVDAIYRLTNNQECYFQEREPIVLAEGVICPFNSQNTAFRREMFPLLYLPAFVNFRFTDILRGLIAQPIMWLAGYHLGFNTATVLQERNPHNYLKDFESEIPCYLYPQRIIDIVLSSIKSSYSLSGNLVEAYRALYNYQIVPQQELEVLSAWLKDLE